MWELQRVTIFCSHTDVFSLGALESGKQSSYFNPDSICIAQMITSHLSKLPALLGFLTFSGSLYKRMFCNSCKQLLKPIGIVGCCRLSRQSDVTSKPWQSRLVMYCHLFTTWAAGTPKSGSTDGSTIWRGNSISCCYEMMLEGWSCNSRVRNQEERLFMYWGIPRQRSVIHWWNHSLLNICSVPGTRPKAVSSKDPDP